MYLYLNENTLPEIIVTTAANLRLILSRTKSNPKLLLESSNNSNLKIKESSSIKEPNAKENEIKQVNPNITENFSD